MIIGATVKRQALLQYATLERQQIKHPSYPWGEPNAQAILATIYAIYFRIFYIFIVTHSIYLDRHTVEPNCNSLIRACQLALVLPLHLGILPFHLPLSQVNFLEFFGSRTSSLEHTNSTFRPWQNSCPTTLAFVPFDGFEHFTTKKLYNICIRIFVVTTRPQQQQE